MAYKKGIFAAVDIGSNSLLLSVVESDGIQFRILEDESHVTGLAKGVLAGSDASPEKIDRSVQVLRRYSEILERYAVQSFQAVATEGIRRLGNADVVRQALEAALQRPIQIIPPLREAELSFWSVQKAHPNSKTPKLVFDIGGASTEIIYGDSHGIKRMCSLKLGSVVLSDRLKLQEAQDPELPLQEVLRLLEASEFNDLRSLAPVIPVGVAGTMTVLISVDRKLETFTRDQVHLQKISTERVRHWQQKICRLNLHERYTLPGLPRDRADVFSGGTSIVLGLAEFFKWTDITCMDTGIRFGLLYEMLEAAQ